MATKPRTAGGYKKGHVKHVRATCLYVATKLGDLLDEVTVVGGLVPTLLIDQKQAGEAHVGTADLDIGLALAIFDDKRYQALTERLRTAGFSPDQNEKGNPTRQRWKIEGPPKVTVDFLIAPTSDDDRGGRVKNIESDFAAIIAPGLRLAFRDRMQVELSGKTIKDEEATRKMWACGPAAFVVMKSLAFRSRGENKDTYDLVYVLREHQDGIPAIASTLTSLLDDAEAAAAVSFLREDFQSPGALGPRRYTEFLFDGRNEEGEADAWGAVQDLLDRLPK